MVGPAGESNFWRIRLVKAEMPRVSVMAAAAISTAVLLSSGCASIGLGEQAETEVVVIAADLELSGEGAVLGAVYRNALELRVEQVNQQGLLGNRTLELVVRDNRTDSGTSAANIAELAADDSVTAIITGGCADCLLAAVDTVNSVGVPTIALAGPDSVASPVDLREYVFKLGPNPADSARVLANELGRAGIETVAVVVSDDDYGADGIRELTAAASRTGVNIVIEELVSEDDEVLQDAASRIVTFEPNIEPFPSPDGNDQLANGPEAVVLWAYSSLANNFAVHLRAAGYEGELFLDVAAAHNLFLTGSVGAALAGATMIFTETLVIDEVIATSPAKTARRTWFNDYSARYGTYHAFASFAADAVQLIVEAVNVVDTTDREMVRAAIETTRLDGLTGPLRMSPQHHSGLMGQGLTALVARGDRWRLAG